MRGSVRFPSYLKKMKKYLIITILILLLSSCATNIRIVKHGPWIPDPKVWVENNQTKISVGIFGWRWLIDYDIIRSE
jgi:uncharacterized lipoprotein YajG